MRILFFISVIFVSNIQAQKTNWVLSKNKNGIKIYTRTTEKSPIKEVMGQMELNTSLSALVSLVKNAENHHNWIYVNKTAYFIKEVNDFEWYYYNESEAIWPIANRDIVSQVKLTQDTTTCAIKINSVGIPDYIGKKEGVVRVLRLASCWDFIPVRRGVVFVKFKLSIDLGGKLPPWAINLAIDKGPLNTLQAMSKEIKREKFKNAKLSFIKEQACIKM
ncbi:MAG: hypothetical protein B6I20_09075 [Bacteroidetes bacterium 4572_117]|nr:MAG: hypothetical protein B6I20_09075 [Bacteroidetes bacterium 4572_117]